ncbi:MAG: hypothetical protein HYZ16_06525 [Bacteroidetes bacterium]|nr:hypothetical protein [Bacteroidota bacterium]
MKRLFIAGMSLTVALLLGAGCRLLKKPCGCNDFGLGDMRSGMDLKPDTICQSTHYVKFD